MNRPSDASDAPLLTADHVVKTFPTKRTLREIVRRIPARRLVAVDDVSLELRRGRVLGIVGESGCGKSTLANCIMNLLTPDSGEILVNGQALASLKGHELRAARRQIQMVFQDPYSSLNPRLTVRQTVLEPVRVHGLVSRGDENDLLNDLLDQVGLRRKDADRYPRNLSGGQRQRVAVARALALKPAILVADEPVSALDVSVQAQILNLFSELQQTLGIAIIFITHQLAVIAHLADDVDVLYLGRVVESGPIEEVFRDSHHPYTQGLLKAQPTTKAKRKDRTPALTGESPSAFEIPSGCRFRTRCPVAEPRCAELEPLPVEVSPGHFASCHVFAAPMEAAATPVPATQGAVMMDNIYEILSDRVIRGEINEARELAENAVANGCNPVDVINGLMSGMDVVSVRFKTGEMFVPEVLFSARAMKAGLEVVRHLIPDSDVKSAGRILIGTVKGDLHDIGKNLVAMMLETAGFTVIDAGVDITPEQFMSVAKEKNVDIVGMSALLTTTMIYMKDTIELMVEEGIRDQIRVVVGGAPVTKEFADEIGADGFAPDAGAAIDLCRDVLARQKGA